MMNNWMQATMGRDGEGFEYDDDDRFAYMDFDEARIECEHEDEDYELVDGRAVCNTCGAVRSLTASEMDEIVKMQFTDEERSDG